MKLGIPFNALYGDDVIWKERRSVGCVGDGGELWVSEGGGEWYHFATSATPTSTAAAMLLLLLAMLMKTLLKLRLVVLEVEGGGGCVVVVFFAVAASVLLREGIQHGGHVAVFVDDVEHSLSFARRHLLRVAGERDRLEVVVGQVDVAQRGIGHVLHVSPTNAKLTAEPIVGPNARFPIEVDATDHLGDTAKLATVVHAEEKDGWAVVVMILERVVQFLVAVIRGAPNSMFDRSSDILFRVALYDIKSGVDGIDVIIRRIEAPVLCRHRRPDTRRRDVVAIR